MRKDSEDRSRMNCAYLVAGSRMSLSTCAMTASARCDNASSTNASVPMGVPHTVTPSGRC